MGYTVSTTVCEYGVHLNKTLSSQETRKREIFAFYIFENTIEKQ